MHATPEAKQPIAIIIPQEPHLRQALKSQGKANADTADMHALCNDPEVVSLILKACNASGKKSGFKPMEILQDVILTADEWTPENGLVTAAQKIQRKKISDAFAKEIEVCAHLLRIIVYMYISLIDFITGVLQEVQRLERLHFNVRAVTCLLGHSFAYLVLRCDIPLPHPFWCNLVTSTEDSFNFPHFEHQPLPTKFYDA